MAIAHGYLTLTDDCAMLYCIDTPYAPDAAAGLAWDDPTVAADWGLTDPILSNRDKSNPRREDIADGLRPRMVMRT